MDLLLVVIIQALLLGSTYALISLGLVLIFRATDTLNFAHGQLMLLGGYIAGRLQGLWSEWGLAVLLVAICAVAAIGALLFRFIFRRAVGQPALVSVIATLGLASVLDGVMAIWIGQEQFRIQVALLPDGYLSVAGARVSAASLVTAGVGFGLAILVAAVLRYTTLGVRLQAAGQDPVLASQSGINVNWAYMAAWAVACGMAALAGIAYGTSNVINPTVIEYALLALPAIMLGGLDSIAGALVGGTGVGVIQAFTSAYVGGEAVSVVTYSLLLLVLLIRPWGLFGTREAVRA